MSAIESLVARGPVVPVIVLSEVAHAVPLAQALLAGGVSTMEITLRTPAALDCIQAVAESVPEMLVGAGTLVSAEDCQAVVARGAKFGVSPGLSPSLHEACASLGLALLPGVSTATDIVNAMQYGYRRLKFFPAEAVGGVKALKALSGPFPQLKFCPTGGISPANAGSYLALPSVDCVGGSWLTPSALIEAGEFEKITALAREASGLTG